jgi:hypothetical protein
VLHLETRNIPLSATALLPPLHRTSTFDFILGNALSHLEGGPQGWAGYRFTTPRPGLQIDGWFAGRAVGRVDFRLRTTVPTRVDAAISPVLTQRDLTEQLIAIYKSAQPYLDSGVAKKRTSDAATIVPHDSLVPDEKVQTRRIETAGGVVIAPEFHWPKYSGFVIIKTLPLAAWERTTITGLTTTPLVLTSDFAQTYAPGHHNFTETFLFEPALDPNVTAEQRAELATADIRLIHVFHDRDLGGPNIVRVIGFDGKARPLP